MGNKFYFRGKLEEDAMYNYLKQRLKHAIRFRHKRGFGVHSPFVFDLITNVIKEKAEYYDFQVVEAQGRIRDKERKLCRMLFRLVDYFSYRERKIRPCIKGCFYKPQRKPESYQNRNIQCVVTVCK